MGPSVGAAVGSDEGGVSEKGLQDDGTQSRLTSFCWSRASRAPTQRCGSPLPAKRRAEDTLRESRQRGGVTQRSASGLSWGGKRKGRERGPLWLEEGRHAPPLCPPLQTRRPPRWSGMPVAALKWHMKQHRPPASEPQPKRSRPGSRLFLGSHESAAYGFLFSYPATRSGRTAASEVSGPIVLLGGLSPLVLMLMPAWRNSHRRTVCIKEVEDLQQRRGPEGGLCVTDAHGEDLVPRPIGNPGVGSTPGPSCPGVDRRHKGGGALHGVAIQEISRMEGGEAQLGVRFASGRRGVAGAFSPVTRLLRLC